jgi:phospholysine phosphohistidine inorganic pyrophosphate phosphatase
MPPTNPTAYLLDLDGTLYAGGAAIPGAVETLGRIRARGVPFRLVTNTTSRSRAMLVERLRSYGFDTKAEEIFTATLAGVTLARQAGYDLVAPFVPEAALEDMTDLDLVGGTSNRPGAPLPRRPAAVIVGDLGERWTYALLQEAFEYLMAGAALIALSRDRYWLRDDRLSLDAGPFVAALEYARGTTALVAGKPSPTFFAAALASISPGNTADAVMVGDDLWSDVQGAQRAGLQGWLVRTGKFRQESLAGSGIVPDRILASIAELA